jgi:hypothetical protein
MPQLGWEQMKWEALRGAQRNIQRSLVSFSVRCRPDAIHPRQRAPEHRIMEKCQRRERLFCVEAAARA